MGRSPARSPASYNWLSAEKLTIRRNRRSDRRFGERANGVDSGVIFDAREPQGGSVHSSSEHLEQVRSIQHTELNSGGLTCDGADAPFTADRESARCGSPLSLGRRKSCMTIYQLYLFNGLYLVLLIVVAV